jgi:hypothetical protein
MIADFVDDGGRVVFLPAESGIIHVAEEEGALTRPPGLHTRHGDGRDYLRPASPFDRRHAQWLAVLIQRVVEAGSRVWAVQDRLFEK